jgi:hypothetical protein
LQKLKVTKCIKERYIWYPEYSKFVVHIMIKTKKSISRNWINFRKITNILVFGWTENCFSLGAIALVCCSQIWLHFTCNSIKGESSE